MNAKTKSRTLFKLKNLLILLLVLVAVAPGALNNRSDIVIRTLVTTLGIDLTEAGEYELTAMMLLPQTSSQSTESQNIVSAAATTMQGAIEDLSLKTGRVPNLDYCDYLVLGKQLAAHDVMAPIDYFLRANVVSNTAMICMTDSTAKETINEMAGLDNLSAFFYGTFAREQKRNNYQASVVVKDFAERYYLKNGDAFMPVFNIVRKTGVEEAMADSGDMPQVEVAGESRTALFHKGKYVRTLDNAESTSLLWLEKKSMFGQIFLPDIDFAGLEHATAALSMNYKKLRIKAKFEQGEPVLEIRFRINATLTEIKADTPAPFFSEQEKMELSKTLRSSLAARVQADMAHLLEVVREEQCDFFGFENRFYQFRTRQYRQFRDAHPDEFFADHLRLSVKVDGTVIV